MNDLQSLTVPPRDDWEDWTDEETITTSTIDNQPLVHLGSPVLPSHSHTATSSKRSNHSSSNNNHNSKSRQSTSTSKIQRLRSRKRQRQQNEKLGIRLDTDMTRFHKGPQHTAQFVPSPLPGHKLPDSTAAKFVDTSALRALEGSPNSASRGNWAWVKKGQGAGGYSSPDGAKIVIGIAMAEQDAASRTISPQTATVATPTNRLPTTGGIHQQHQQQPQSAWSPDTEDGYSPARHFYQQGIYAQATAAAPPVTVPAAAPPAIVVKNAAQARLSRGDIIDDKDDDDQFTPVTLFEEDGRNNKSNKSPESTTRSQSGWWDHVRTPFKERFSPIAGSNTNQSSPVSPDEWWKGANEKNKVKVGPMSQHKTAEAENPSPAIASSSRSPPITSDRHAEAAPSEKYRAAAAVAEEDHQVVAEGDMPPPYERNPSSKQAVPPAACLTIFPPHPPQHYVANPRNHNHPINSPGLDGTMSSQGAKTTMMVMMTDVPLTPAPYPGAAVDSHKTGASASTSTSADGVAPLPDRLAGTYTGDQFATVHGDDPASRVERTRRRHEKEDVLAHRAGGFWKGRGCMPENGCYGRTGREGRQRRRVWLFVCLAVWALIITGVTLGVVLSRKLQQSHASSSSSSSGTASSSGAAATTTASGLPSANQTSSSNPSVPNSTVQPPSVWVNLTNFPPIPTGVATVVGADNSEAITGCITPATLWSCSLPPEQQAANEPSDADQPMFIFQIQYDNSTRMLWDVPNGTPPSSVARREDSADDATGYDAGINPDPAPPSFDEMWFLGNYTDGIVSANKSGEPTPFYISFFASLNDTAGPNMLTDDSSSTSASSSYTVPTSYNYSGQGGLDGTLPVPPLAADGTTGAPAQLRPFPFQQPLRLFDRGLPTEHYGFYSYFNKTIYVTDVTDAAAAKSPDPVGGVRQSSATWYAEWSQTRFVVKIWTQKGSAAGTGARLIGGDASNTTTPGSFLYPMTIGEDTHGGDSHLKYAFAYGVEADGAVNRTNVQVFENQMNFSSPVVNPAWPDGDISLGGLDGGTGGCRCEWVNWVEADGQVDETFG